MIRGPLRFPAVLAGAAGIFMVSAFISHGLAQTTDPARLFQDAISAQRRGDLSSAIRQYHEALKAKPDMVPAWINLGVALVQTGQFAEAIESYHSALALDPQNRSIRIYLALAYFKHGDAATASRQFEDLLNSDPKDVRVATLLAASDLQNGDPKRALSALEPLKTAAGDNPDFNWAMATALVASGQRAEGAAAAERVAHQSNAAEAWLLAGQNLLATNEFVRAAADLEKAASSNPSLPGVQTALAQAREKNADFAGAIEAFHKAVEQNPKDFDAWLGLGSDQYFVRDLDAAKGSLKVALRLDLSSAAALYAMALVEKAQSQPDAALARLEDAVKIRPDWMEAHVQLAALYLQLHRTAEGMRERQIVDKLSEQQRQAGPGVF